MPYLDLDGSGAPAPDVELRVTGATEFQLVDGFIFQDPDQDGRQVMVPDGLPTDLASVPFFLQWLVRSYGRHTRGALLHDTYWRWARTASDLRDINRLFRDAMRDSGTPLVRRWFVWGAVTMAGLARLGLVGTLRLAAWAVALVVAAAGVVAGAGATVRPALAVALTVVLAVVAAVAALVGRAGAPGGAQREVSAQVAGITAVYAALIGGGAALVDWGVVRDHPAVTVAIGVVVALAVAWPLVGASLIEAVTVVVVALPTTAVFAALAVYGVAELVAYGVRYAIHAAQGRPKPAPPASKALHRPTTPA